MSRQQGLTLVELLIGLLLSSLLVITMTGLYLAIKRTYLFQEALLSMQGNSRLLISVLTEHLDKAGYRTAYYQSYEQVFPQLSYPECMPFASGDLLVPALTEQGFCIRYQPTQNNQLDCAGHQLTETAVLVFALRLASNASDSGALYCKNLAAANPQWVELVAGIADVELEYLKPADSSRYLGVNYRVLLISETAVGGVIDQSLTDWQGARKAQLAQEKTGYLFQPLQFSKQLRHQP